MCWQTGTIPKLTSLLEEEDDDPDAEPDAIVVVPHKKVKLVVGPGGEKIKHIQQKSKCRLQVSTCAVPLLSRLMKRRSCARLGARLER